MRSVQRIDAPSGYVYNRGMAHPDLDAMRRFDRIHGAVLRASTLGRLYALPYVPGLCRMHAAFALVAYQVSLP